MQGKHFYLNCHTLAMTVIILFLAQHITEA